MKLSNRICRLAVLPLAMLLPLTAQDKAKDKKKGDKTVAAAPQTEGITREQADAIIDELRQIRLLLEKQGAGGAQAKAAEPPAPIKAKLNLAGAPMLGNKDAPVTMVEFTDYQCPFCQRFHMQTFAELKKEYIDTGKVRFYSKDLPLDSLHPNATRAAQASHCANDQGQFWKMRDIMGAHPEALDLNSLVADAAGLKMNADAFKSCVESGKYKELVQTEYLEAMRIGADGTPAFVIGKSTSDGVDGELMVGALPLQLFERRFSDLGVK